MEKAGVEVDAAGAVGAGMFAHGVGAAGAEPVLSVCAAVPCERLSLRLFVPMVHARSSFTQRSQY